MKKILHLFLVIASFGFYSGLKAQCDLALSNVSVELVGTPVVIGPNKCQITVNVQFDLDYNGGSKYVYFHSYLAADYPSPSVFNCGSSASQDPPTHNQLGTAVDDIGKSMLDVGLDNSSGHGTLNVPVSVPILTSYLPDPTVVLTQPSNSLGMTVTKTFKGGMTDHFVISNLKVTFNQSCAAVLIVKTDVWASNSNAASAKAQCYICGSTQIFNDPTITGFKRCNRPRTLSIGIQTVSTTPITVSYSLYKSDGDASFEPGTDDILVGGPSGPFTISAGSPYFNDNVSYTGNNAPGEKSDIWVAVTASSNTGMTTLSLFENGACFPLPVKLTYFNARRNNASNVGLTWQTAQELNASGFEIQRQVGSGGWQVVGFVATQALNGNSSSLLNYSFNDVNGAKGISQYRLRAIDIDANSKFSEIRAVRGDGQAGKIIVYPNPSFDGKVRVIFEDVNGTRDVSLTDMSGRLVKQWAGVTNNNLQIDNVPAGYYGLRVVVRETGEQSIEKIVVNKR